MDPSNVSLNSYSTSSSSSTQANYGASVMRKVLDIQASQGAALAQMVAQAAGVGQNLDVTA